MQENNGKKETRLQVILKKELKKWPSKIAMAEMLDITDAYLSQLISGKRTGKRIIEKLARRLDISPLELMENVKLAPREMLISDDKVRIYTVSEFLAVCGTTLVIPPPRKAEAERGNEMTQPMEEGERRVGISINNNNYQPVFLAGDVLIVDPDITPQIGDICMIIIGDDLLFRRLVHLDNDEAHFALPSDEFRQEVIKKTSPVRLVIWGKVVKFWRDL
jgi:plasmid maintenance system antidote protein VapI